jgi:hypothetical protein
MGSIASGSVCQVLYLCIFVLWDVGGAIRNNRVVFKIYSANLCRDKKSPIDVVLWCIHKICMACIFM